MSAASLAQYGAFLLIVALLVRPVGGYLARVFSGERTWLDPVMRPLERAIYRLAGVDADRRDGLEALCRVLRRVRPRRHAAAVRGAAGAAVAPHVRPGVPAGAARSRPRDEHGDQLRDHDDLAGVRRRDHDELSEPGLRSHVPEFPGRSRRPRRRHRVHPGPGPAAHTPARQLLGGRDPRDALGAAAPRGGERPGARVAGRAHELRPVRARARSCSRSSTTSR